MSLLSNKEHLSASEVNRWISAPGILILTRYLMEKEPPKAVMALGTAVEQGMYHHLMGATELALAVAEKAFWEGLAGEVTEDAEKQLARMRPMLSMCKTWDPPGPLLAHELKIEFRFPENSLPFVGYLDFSFEDVDVDLKTTGRMPSAATAPHMRQVALYRAARKKRGGLLYVTERRREYYELLDVEAESALRELERAALSYERFPSKFETAEEALHCLAIDRDSYMFSEAMKLKLEELHL